MYRCEFIYVNVIHICIGFYMCKCINIHVYIFDIYTYMYVYACIYSLWHDCMYV